MSSAAALNNHLQDRDCRLDKPSLPILASTVALARCSVKETVACSSWGFRGLSGGGGGFSQYISVYKSQLSPIPDELLPYGALVEPMVVAWHAVKRLDIEDFSNKSALIIGGGPIGIALVLVSRAFSASNIIVSEPTAARRKRNKDLASYVLNPID
jgi:threonine dehydrogenase-like Zn-dependent dehydrogenase